MQTPRASPPPRGVGLGVGGSRREGRSSLPALRAPFQPRPMRSTIATRLCGGRAQRRPLPLLTKTRSFVLSAAYEQKLNQARKLAREAGLRLSYDVPPVLRVFGKLGLPVRPIHFMSASGLFAYYFFVLGAVFLGIYWLVSALDFNRWVLIKIKEMGPMGALALAACLALFDTIMVRAQARRSGLPDWRGL